jgi:hypothetical protein
MRVHQKWAYSRAYQNQWVDPDFFRFTWTGAAKLGESELTDECHETPDKEENPPPKSTQAQEPKSTQAQEEQEFSELVGKEHVDQPTKIAEKVRSILERIKARNNAS